VRLFRQYGLPEIIRTDNGVPWASTGLARLTRLSVWWLKLGIRLERIVPGCPTQNGAHERMHRTLKAECTRPPASGRRGQQRLFNQFRTCYNEERPHQGIDGHTPAELYEPSGRPFPEELPSYDYPAHLELRLVSGGGMIRWMSQPIFLTNALIGEYVAVDPISDGVLSILFRDLELGRFDQRTGTFHPGGVMGPKREHINDDNCPQ
jgi:putative transposase